MERLELLRVLSDLNKDDPADRMVDLDELLNENLHAVMGKLNITVADLPQLVFDALKHNKNDESTVWKYICANFYVLFLLRTELDKSADVLSVQHAKKLKSVLKNLIEIGISSNLLTSISHKSTTNCDSQGDLAFTRYCRLAATTEGMFECFKNTDLRSLILSNFLKCILAALYQLSCCPLAKPSNKSHATGFVMTEDLYMKLLGDQEHFKRLLRKLGTTIHLTVYARETMLLAGKDSPAWLQKSVARTLNSLILAPKGVESVLFAMLGGESEEGIDDTTKSWRSLDVVVKIIINLRKLPEFRTNICSQLISLLVAKNNSGTCIKAFERLFSLCTKMLYQSDKNLAKAALFPCLFKSLIDLTEGHNFYDANITDKTSQTLRLLNLCYLDRHLGILALPLTTLKPLAWVIFRLYSVVFEVNALKAVSDDANSLLLFVLKEGHSSERFALLDSFLFGFCNEDCLQLAKNLDLGVQNDLIIARNSPHALLHRSSKYGNAIMRLMRNDPELLVSFFEYLLSCVIERERYFFRTASKDLLQIEEELVIPHELERNITVYNLLSLLAENKNVQKCISSKPAGVVKYIHNNFLSMLVSKVHTTTDDESEAFASAFVVCMILHSLINSAAKSGLDEYKLLIVPMQEISAECVNVEMKALLDAMIANLLGNVEHTCGVIQEQDKTYLDEAILDVCDPLLPVRGHGLMTLAKLVEKKDKHALERKQYILNIFQQNIKNEDSFIYLNAIAGLAALAHIFPDTVLNTLAEEYSEFSDKNGEEEGHDVRLKLGEVLVRVSKTLGEMAVKHKSLLLNTFMVGTKDDDHLVRASSLSNLGEVCKVMGYKLGSIVTEVLVCVHAVITTDKAVEARRAAVMVLRQLFVGLEKDMIVFLKEEILPIYRTLKTVYNNDSDDVMRLQAQLALEELNANMKNFVFPNPQIHFEKNIVTL